MANPVNVRVVPLDSATQLDDTAAGNVFIIGSQATVGPALWAAQAEVRALILHDTGIGKDQAGLSALPYLQKLGMAAAVIDSKTARISDGKDMLARGGISHFNDLAKNLGVTAGQPCQEAATLLRKANPFGGTPDASDEPQRHLLDEIKSVRIIGLDTMGLIKDEDAGQIILTGSHGGLVGGGDPQKNPMAATRGIKAKAAVFHDGGLCLDGSSTSRLPALDQQAIPAATVSALSARISDSVSVYKDGEISLVNKTAGALGASIGMSSKDFCKLVAGQ